MLELHAERWPSSVDYPVSLLSTMQEIPSKSAIALDALKRGAEFSIEKVKTVSKVMCCEVIVMSGGDASLTLMR